MKNLKNEKESCDKTRVKGSEGPFNSPSGDTFFGFGARTSVSACQKASFSSSPFRSCG